MKKSLEEPQTQVPEITSKINFKAGNLTVRSLNTQDYQALATLFLDKTNPAVLLYADGTHGKEEKIKAKVDVWGGRDRDNDLFRCFLFYSEENDAEPIGFINFGKTNIQYKSQPAIEFSILFKNATPAKQITTAAEAVISYLKNPLAYYSQEDQASIDMDKVKEYQGLVGTVSLASEGIYDALKGAGFSCSTDVPIIGVNNHLGTNIITLNYIDETGRNVTKSGIPGNRFKVTHEGQLLEQFSSHTGLQGQYEYLEKVLYVHPLGAVQQAEFDLPC